MKLENIDLIIVVRVDRDHARIVEPAMRGGKRCRIQPFAPKDRAVVVEQGFGWLPIRIELAARDEAIRRGHRHRCRPCKHQRRSDRSRSEVADFCRTFCATSLCRETGRLRFRAVERDNAIGIVERINFPGRIVVGLTDGQARFDELVKMIRERCRAGARVHANHTARP